MVTGDIPDVKIIFTSRLNWVSFSVQLANMQRVSLVKSSKTLWFSYTVFKTFAESFLIFLCFLSLSIMRV